MSFENDFVKLEYEKETLFVNIIAKKPLPKDDDEFNEFYNYFDIFYQACYQNKKKIILFYDLTKLGVLKSDYYKKWIKLFRNYEFMTLECLICSSVICNNTRISKFINGVLKMYGNTKPIKILNNREDALEFVNKNL